MKSRIVRSMAQVICNKCKKVILMSKDIFRAAEFEEGIKVEWFRCPECGKIYVYSVTDEELRSKIKPNTPPTDEMIQRSKELFRKYGNVAMLEKTKSKGENKNGKI